METRANYALIGAFTLAIIAAGFMFVYWFSSPGKSSQPKTFQIIFTGSVSGLSRGSQVLFNGLRVGEVREIDLLQEDPSHVSAIIDVNNRTPVKEDTTARLESQGLTGVAAIALAGGSPNAAPPKEKPDGSPPVIQAEPSQIQNILESVEKLSTKADALIDKADKLLGDNSASISGTVKNAEVFTKALADSSPQIDSFLEGMGGLGHTIGPLADKLQTLSQDVDRVVKAVDPDKVHAVVDNVASVTDTIAKSNPQITEFLADAATVARKLGEAAGRVDDLVASARETVRAVDPAKVAASVDGLSRIIASLDQNRGNIEQVLKDAPHLTAQLNTAAGDLGKVTAALARNEHNIDQIFANVTDFATGLGATKGRLDGVLASAGDLVRAVDPTKVASVVDSVQHFAATIDQNKDNIDKVLKGAPQLTAQLNAAAGDLGKVTAALARNEHNIDQIFANVTDFASGLGATKGRLDGVLASAGDLVRAVDPAKVSSVVESVQHFAMTIDQNKDNIDKVLKDAPQLTAQLNAAAGDLGKVTAMLARNEHNIDQILANVTDFASGLGATKGRLDGVLASAGDVVRAVDPAKVSAVVDSVQRLAATIDQNRDNIDQTLKNVPKITADLGAAVGDAKTVTAALARNEPQINSILNDTAAFVSGLGATKSRLDEVLAGAGDVVKAVDPAKVAAVVDNVQHLATTIEQNSSNIDQVLKDAPKLVADLGVAAENAKSITAALARNEPHIDSILADTASFVSGLGTTQSRLDGVLDDARGILKGVDAGKVEAIVDDIRRVADSFDQGRGKITAIFNDTAGFTGRLSGMADRLDSVLNGANGLLGSGEAKGALVEVGAAAHSIRILADHLDERTKDITTGINRFTGSGLRDLEAIATDGKRTLGNIDRTLTSVQRNPQQFLLGTKSSIPEYSSGQ